MTLTHVVFLLMDIDKVHNVGVEVHARQEVCGVTRQTWGLNTLWESAANNVRNYNIPKW